MLEVSNFASNVYMRTEDHKLAVEVKWFPLYNFSASLPPASLQVYGTLIFIGNHHISAWNIYLAYSKFFELTLVSRN